METCPKCLKSYPSYYLWKTHMRSHSNERPFPCRECHKAFRTARELSVHTRNHLPIEVRYSCACPVCGKRFTVKGNLNTHMKVHTGEKPFTCDICGKQFSQKGNLQSHQRRHAGKPSHIPLADRADNVGMKVRRHTCATCFKSFCSAQVLQRHQLLHRRHPYSSKMDERPQGVTEIHSSEQSPCEARMGGDWAAMMPAYKQYLAMHELLTLALLQHSIFS